MILNIVRLCKTAIANPELAVEVGTEEDISPNLAVVPEDYADVNILLYALLLFKMFLSALMFKFHQGGYD